MRLRELRLRPFRIPLAAELRWGAGKRMDALEHALVEVTLEGGAVGRGEVAVRPTIYGETLGSVRAALEWLEPRLREVDVSNAGAVRRVLARLPGNLAAKAGLEMALFEARAAALGRDPLDLLPVGRERVRVSFIVGQGDVEATLASAGFAHARGVRVFKLKTSGRAAEDEARIRALVEAFPDAEVYVDANETLAPRAAAEVLERWRALGVTMVEEPLPVERVRARAALRRRGILPLIADDAAFTPRDLERELELDTFDVLNVKPARSGFGPSLEMLDRARAAGKEAMIGSQAMSGFGAARAAALAFHAAVTRPSELAFHLLAAGGFAPFPPIREGWLERRDLAFGFSETAFARWAL
ncbi:enolase C-terminal domain-like protein [Oceanithermus profundus]